jgi:hypothetical protein
MKNTRGPWRRAGNIIWGAEIQSKVAQVYSQAGLVSAEEEKANSILIATAPELLDALRSIISELHMSGCINYMNEASAYAEAFNEKLHNAERVIIKATGGEK